MSSMIQIKMNHCFRNFDIDVNLKSDTSIGLIGPNGAGKSLFLKFILGANSSAQGRVNINGEEWFSSKDGINLPIEKRRCCYIPQGFSLFQHLSVVENITFGLSRGLSKKDRYLKADALLERFDIQEHRERNVNTLSGGESQKVALARALAGQPRLLLLDEPFSALDIIQRDEIAELVRELVTELKVLAIITSHSVRDFSTLSWPLYVIENGKITDSGTIPELKKNPKSQFIAEFFKPIL